MKTRMREEETERDGHGGCRPSAAGGRGSGGVSKEERELLLSRGWRCSGPQHVFFRGGAATRKTRKKQMLPLKIASSGGKWWPEELDKGVAGRVHGSSVDYTMFTMPNRGSVLRSLCLFPLIVSQKAKVRRNNGQKSPTKPKAAQLDRISILPDEIICHILSFLPTTEAVTTSVLSTRWRSLWTLVLTLDFDDNWPCFFNTTFASIFGSILAQHKAKCIKRLCLYNYSKPFSLDLIGSLVSTAVAQNLEEMDLICNYYFEVTLPNTLFTCKTISVLKLSLGLTINLNNISSIHLPSLKVLHLDVLYLVDDESIMRLFSGCPVLEELCYEEVKSNNSTSFKICVPSLKKLHLKCHDKRVQVVTPSLEYLQVQETKVHDSLVGNLPNLLQAHADIYFDQHEKECPKLEILDIDKVYEESERKWTQPTAPVPSCISSHLTAFKFREYGGSKYELELTKYILKNAKVLKTVTVKMAKWLVTSDDHYAVTI
ncbi:FBD-associated F-box protein [Glycine soja]|nr:FBD-associated F-box protein [Glycine soja]